MDRLPVGHAFASDAEVMNYALSLARRGLGYVEPNPPVGAVLVDAERRLIADGWHTRYGEPHAEVHAISAAGDRATGAQLFVTLEPCCHFGKTPPCADAVIRAGIQQVHVGCLDPAPHVSGGGIQRLKEAGLTVSVGLYGSQAEALIAPFRKLMLTNRPWVHVKWAMTLDGRIATRTGHSKWISGEESRAEVHRLRGRMDAILTGAGTLRADDPQLTARPPGPRVPVRIIVDRDGSSLSLQHALVRTRDEAPVILCVRETPNDYHRVRLEEAGVEVLAFIGESPSGQIHRLLEELGRRKQTHVLVEAGAGLMGTLFDAALVDEVHAFVAPKMIGGTDAMPPVGGLGLAEIPAAASLTNRTVRFFGEDVLISGHVKRG